MSVIVVNAEEDESRGIVVEVPATVPDPADAIGVEPCQWIGLLVDMDVSVGRFDTLSPGEVVESGKRFGIDSGWRGIVG